MSPIRNENNAIEIATSLKGGFVSTLDPMDVGDENSISQINIRNLHGGLYTRTGNSKYSLAKPNALPIIYLSGGSTTSSAEFVHRHTATTLHKSNGFAWIAVTGAAFTPGVTKIRSLNNPLLGYVFANGLDFIQVADYTGITYARLGNAPVAQYLASYGNRYIAADSTTLYWSGDLNYTEWNPLVDISAGSSVLADNSSDVSDGISEIIVVGSNLVVLKQRSIWIGTLQASASNPFYFRKAIDNIGCDCPNTVTKIPDGLVFADVRTQSVYVLQVKDGNVSLNVISTVVYNNILPPVGLGYGAYDTNTSEYRLWKSLKTTYLYSFLESGWSQNDLAAGLANNITFIGNFVDAGASSAKKYFGMSDGEILVENPAVFLDDGQVYTGSLSSKVFKARSINKKLLMAQLSIAFRDNVAGTLVLRVLDGDTSVQKAIKTITCTGNFVRRTCAIKKVISARTLYWTLTWTPAAATQTLAIDEYAFKAHEINL